MTNPYYSKGTAINPFVLADARDVSNEFAAVELGFDAITSALTENRLASTSTTSLVIGTGSKTLLIETGRAFAIGQFVSIARTADPTNYMNGQVTSYNATTGILVVNVVETAGSGTFSAWTVSLSLPGATANFVRKTGDTMTGPLNLVADPATDTEAARKAYVDAVATAAAILAKLMTVDGSGSGLDADMLDGLHANAFAQLSGATFGGAVSVVNGTGGSARVDPSGDITANRGNGTGVYYFTGTGTRYLFFNGGGFDLVGGQLAVNSSIAWNAGNDGAGSGLDADLLDGLDSAAFVRTNGASTITGPLRVSYDDGLLLHPTGNARTLIHRNDGVNYYLLVSDPSTSPSAVWNSLRPFSVNLTSGQIVSMNGQDFRGGMDVQGYARFNGSDFWHAGNDGSGSGLDADLFDGFESSAFFRTTASVFSFRSSPSNGYAEFSEGSASNPGHVAFRTSDGVRRGYVGWRDGAANRLSLASENGWGWGFDATPTVAGNAMWHAGNDGSGSGLDADLLDGLDSAAFVRTSGGTLSAAVFRFLNTENASIASRPSGETTLTAYGNGTGPAIMTFHRPGGYAAFFGLDTDNRWKVGGWSMGAAAFEVWHAGNDGAGSGLDADLLDGLDSLAFARLSASVNSADLADAVGYKGVPISQKTGAYTLALTEIGRLQYVTAGTFAITIPNDGTTNFPDGTVIPFICEDAAKTIVPAAGVTLVQAGTGATGTRTLAIGAQATITKVQGNRWYIAGAGVS